MSPAKIRNKILNDRISLIREMILKIRSIPMGSYEEFEANMLYEPAVESFLRKAIEALMDIGRHILAKGFAIAVGEYKIIASRLLECGVIDKQNAALYENNAGYRNRMVHYYHEISKKELYSICKTEIIDIERIVDSITIWLESHPEMVDKSL